jgi:hypothetical protein
MSMISHPEISFLNMFLRILYVVCGRNGNVKHLSTLFLEKKKNNLQLVRVRIQIFMEFLWCLWKEMETWKNFIQIIDALFPSKPHVMSNLVLQQKSNFIHQLGNLTFFPFTKDKLKIF